MLASVSWLTPRRGSYDEAVRAFRGARLQQCVSELRGDDSMPARLLRARAYVRLRDSHALIKALTGIAGENSRERAEIALLLSIGHARLGDVELAHGHLRDAFAYSVSATDLALEAEVEVYGALAAFAECRFDDAREGCRAGLIAAATSDPFMRPGDGIVRLDHVRSAIHELLGVVDAAEGKYRSQLGHARTALATLDACEVPDVYHTAYALRNLSILTRDFDLEDEARSLLARVPELAWTADLAAVEFTTAEALGWCSALRGNAVEALRLFRRAGEAATTTPERVIVGVDRALIARECGHTAMVVEEIEHALLLARAFDWERAAGDSRYALLTLAQAAAPIAPARAREMLDRYSAIRNAMDRSYAARLEPRIRAEEAYSNGVVLRAEGRLTASAERLQVAFETWETIGYAWRAGRAALELAELDAGDVFRLAVRRELFSRPHSIFAERAQLVA